MTAYYYGIYLYMYYLVVKDLEWQETESLRANLFQIFSLVFVISSINKYIICFVESEGKSPAEDILYKYSLLIVK